MGHLELVFNCRLVRRSRIEEQVSRLCGDSWLIETGLFVGEISS